MTERIVVIGADAAGMSAASQAKRIAGDAVEIVAFERGAYSSYSACGIPYWVAGDVDGPEHLVARSPGAHRRNGIDLRTRTEVEKIDLQAGRVLAHDLAAGRSFGEGFDSLVIATGAVPVRPALPGVDAAGVFGVQTLDDGTALLADLHRAQPRRAVVVGGGYIGVEMAEALVRRGVAVTVVDQAAQPMTTLDPDMGAAVKRAMEDIGIDVRTDTAVIGFETGSNHRIRSVLTADGSIPADVVVLGLGVRPNTALAQDAGLALGDHGGLRTNVQMQVLGHENIWAGGDCVEVLNLVSGQYQHVALGTHANKQGRVIGHNLAGSYATFPGVVGTAVDPVPRSFDLAGVALSAFGLLLLTFGFVDSADAGWQSPVVAVCVAGGIAVLAVFVAWERRAAAPMVPPALLRTPGFGRACAVYLLAYLAFSGFIYYVTLFFQDVQEWSALRTGLSWLFFCIPYFVVAQLGKRLARWLPVAWAVGSGCFIAARACSE